MRIGYLGVGNMGRPMAGKLIDGGHELWVADVREEAMRPLLDRQARLAETPKALGDACETVVVSLPTLDVFRRTVIDPEGLFSGKAIRTLVNTCTVGAPFIAEIAAAGAARGITVIDAPISGGPSGAAAGTLAVMVSGDPVRVAELMPLFRLWGTTVVTAGETPGAAQIMKLTNNVVFAVGLVATAEAMTMATKGGIPEAAMLEVLNNGSGRNFASASVYPRAVLPRTFDYGATFDIIMKDVDLAVSQGEALGVPMWVCQAARLVLKHAMFQGRGSEDLSSIGKIVEQGARKG